MSEVQKMDIDKGGKQVNRRNKLVHGPITDTKEEDQHHETFIRNIVQTLKLRYSRLNAWIILLKSHHRGPWDCAEFDFEYDFLLVAGKQQQFSRSFLTSQCTNMKITLTVDLSKTKWPVPERVVFRNLPWKELSSAPFCWSSFKFISL